MTMIKITPIEDTYAPQGASFTFVSATTLEPSFPTALTKSATAKQSDLIAEDFEQALKTEPIKTS